MILIKPQEVNYYAEQRHHAFQVMIVDRGAASHLCDTSTVIMFVGYLTAELDSAINTALKWSRGGRRRAGANHQSVTWRMGGYRRAGSQYEGMSGVTRHL